MDKPSGKKLLQKVIHGGQPPADLAAHSLLKTLSRLSMLLRWLAIDCLPREFEHLTEQKDKWAESAILAVFWQRAEDFILQAWGEWIVQQPIAHLSLHFDGVRIDRSCLEQLGTSVADFNKQAEDAIAVATGFSVCIVEKLHQTFAQLLRQHEHADCLLPEAARDLITRGNCIPLAVWHLLTDKRNAVVDLVTERSATNAAATTSGLRSYRACFRDLALQRLPHVGFNPTGSGHYLLHSAGIEGRQHCVAVAYDTAAKTARVFDTEQQWVIPLKDFKKIVNEAIDKKTIVTFQIAVDASDLHTFHSESDCAVDLDGLCDLQAGTFDDVDDSTCIADQETHPVELPCFKEVRDNPSEDVCEVRVEMLSALEAEVLDYTRELRSSNFPHTRQGVQCQLCPFRHLRNKAELLNHLQRRHVLQNTFTASGRKQLNVVYALWDHDQHANHRPQNLLKRSAQEIRSTVQPSLAGRIEDVDRHIVLVLGANGPRYCNERATVQQASLRRVGYTYYDASFADMLLQEAMVHHGRIRPIMARVSLDVVRRGSRLRSLLPAHINQWMQLLEDVLGSPYVGRLKQGLRSSFLQRGEFEHLSIDATIRIMRQVKGQADYRCPADVRNAAPIPDEDAKRRILTVMGRTSVPLASLVVRDEGTDTVVDALSNAWDPAVRAQVRTICSDQPSRTLFHGLRGPFTFQSRTCRLACVLFACRSSM